MTLPFDQLAALDVLTLSTHTQAAGDLLDHATRLAQLRASAAAGDHFLLVERDGKVVAYANYTVRTDKQWFVLMLNIHPAHRNAAVTAEIAQRSLALFVEHGVQKVVSHVYRNNPASLRFHRKLGFNVTRENDKALEFTASPSELALLQRVAGRKAV
ncbi:GNAT family N-acetyltransferase [Chitinimonas naiadis]